MTLRHLQVFLAVCNTGSTTKASENLFISQPSVSITIKDMENYYGVPLFERVSKKWVPTSEGRIVYEYASHIISQFNDMNASLKKLKTGGSLHVGTGLAVGQLVMPRLACDFRVLFPAIDLHVNVSSSETAERLLYENILDLAILEDTIHVNNLVQIPLDTVPLVAVSRDDHPLFCRKHITLEDLSKETLLLRDKFSHTRNVIDNAFAQQGLSVYPMWESCSGLALINAVGEGLGISILPLNHVRSFPHPRVRILDIDLHLAQQINIIYSKARNLSTPAAEFIKYCQTTYHIMNTISDFLYDSTAK